MRLPQTLLATLILSIAWSADTVTASEPGNLKIEPHDFRTGNGDKLNAELGRLVVPENRTKPESRPIQLVFVRFKSTAENPGLPIVYLAGGPGGSGIEIARGARYPVFDAMRAVGDVIALDQRGTG